MVSLPYQEVVSSSLGMGDTIASLTTISTPHNGSKTIDLVMKLPRFLIRFGCFCTDCWFRLLGDKKPGEGVSDIVDVYKQIVFDLMNSGL